MVFLEAFLSLRWTKQENNHLRYFLNLFPPNVPKQRFAITFRNIEFYTIYNKEIEHKILNCFCSNHKMASCGFDE